MEPLLADLMVVMWVGQMVADSAPFVVVLKADLMESLSVVMMDVMMVE
jgi:hypothetical protein